MTGDLIKQIEYIHDEKINDKEAFLVFLEVLRTDFLTNPEEWENRTVAEYVDAMKSWIEDYSACGRTDVDWDNVGYATMAKILYAGRIYE